MNAPKSLGRYGLVAVMAAVALLALACPDDPTHPTCTTDDDCEVGSICDDGTCAEAACPAVFQPVCGVDGMTYDNECSARAAHVEVAHTGECGTVCGGIQGIACPDGQLCDLPPGMCQGADLQGSCVDRPEVCTQQFDPVCGCDGVTYGNDCERLAAGAQLDHEGECEIAEDGDY